FWQTAERRPAFPRFYKQFLALRRSSAALRRGETEWLKNSDESRVLTYARRYADEEIVVAINFSSQPFAGTVETRGGPFDEITPDILPPLPADATPQQRAARLRTTGLPALSLEAWGYRVYRRPVK
ncbi:MAG TPA: alpha-glucosidase C-terminal domain-containing protein, partial [Pyrinomonadaceae bacterium]